MTAKDTMIRLAIVKETNERGELVRSKTTLETVTLLMLTGPDAGTEQQYSSNEVAFLD